jgi:mono/diheme cytochrome c family protein
VLVGLTTGHKIGLAAVAAVFIVFALLSALVVPRWRPDFPGRWLRLYVPVVVLLFVGMMTAVFVFGKEGEEGGKAATESRPAETTQATTATTGNTAAGKHVFAAEGCASCHTFKAANATGTVGPDLDTVLKGKDASFIRTSIVDPNAEIAKGYPPNVMPQDFGQRLSDTQLSNLVAFVSQAA